MYSQLLLLFLPLVSTSNADCECGRRPPTKRIVGGTPAKNGEYPWLGLVRTFIAYKNFTHRSASCGGSLINDQWILTAAHCIADIENYVEKDDVIGNITYVALGRSNVKDILPRKLFDMQSSTNIKEFKKLRDVYRVDRVVVHESYRTDGDENDIALLHLAKPVDFGYFVSPVCLDSATTKFESLEVAGWGNIGHDKPGGSENLLRTDVQEVEHSECIKAYSSVDQKKQFCYTSGKTGTCHGDSGGPLVREDSSRLHQVGIVSFGGKNCENPETPNVAIRVSAYYDWILSHASNGKWCK